MRCPLCGSRIDCTSTPSPSRWKIAISSLKKVVERPSTRIRSAANAAANPRTIQASRSSGCRRAVARRRVAGEAKPKSARSLRGGAIGAEAQTGAVSCAVGTTGDGREPFVRASTDGYEMTIESSHDRSTARLSTRVRAIAAGTLVAAVAVSVLACGAGSPVAAPGEAGRTSTGRGWFGVQPGPMPFDATDAAKMGRTGIGTARIALNWLWVQPRRGPFNWTRIDEQVGPLAANGVAAVPMLAATPRWVTRAP